MTLGAGWIFSGINYGVNKVLYCNEIKNTISNNILEQNFVYHFEDKINLVNVSQKGINLQINELENYTNTTVYIKYKYKKENGDEYIISKIIGMDNFSNKREVDYDENRIIFIDDDKECESIEVNVLTNNKDNVNIEGAFDIK